VLAAAQAGSKARVLPVTWKFRQDPKDEGPMARRFGTTPDAAWRDICTEGSWTTQEGGKGYHGTAWYSVAFIVPGDAAKAATRTVVRQVEGRQDTELVRICAEETELSSINPLEIPPMGDCDLALLKREYGHQISLMGNLHTTEVMLKGSVQTVIDAAKQAIDDAAAGGGFILSTGDQCGRDTPDENLRALIDTARAYGKY